MKIYSYLLFIAVLFISTFSACSNSTSGNSDSSKAGKETTAEAITDNIPVGLAIGNRAPDIEFPSPDGSVIRLSSLRGKVVLIDFWASWCPPCRIENPNLVKAYHEFKDKKFKAGDGFAIYSVSLDQDKNRWIDAIKADKLDWKSHVSDLKGWSSVPAAMYQVRAIPGNFLIDGKGVILATELRGELLDETLKGLLN